MHRSRNVWESFIIVLSILGIAFVISMRLQVNMANIRKKLGIKPGDNRFFLNELGVGYRMREENE